MMLLGCCRFPLTSDVLAKNTRRGDINRSGVSCKVATPQIHVINGEYSSSSKKKGFDVTILGDRYGFGDPDD
ncbi:hypothetical protein OIU84_015005, partial [Salix udensis]